MRERTKTRLQYVGLAVLAVVTLIVVVYSLSGDYPPMIPPEVFR